MSRSASSSRRRSRRWPPRWPIACRRPSESDANSTSFNARSRSPCKGVASPGPSFAPKVIADGTLFDFQQQQTDGHVDFRLGFIRLEWTLFEGGRRIAATRVADSQVRQAMAQAESIADKIAFQVNEAYRNAVTAWVGIDDARPAVDQARRELPARATAAPRGCGHAHRDCRRAGLADPCRAELPERPV